jgi:hypothetical protein
MTAAALLLEAKAEFDAWDATGRVVAFQAGSVVYSRRYKARKLKCECGKRAVRNGRCSTCRVAERAARKPPCACGSPYFARDLCSSCYYKEINKRRRRVLPKIKGKCECGRSATRRSGQCVRCYSRIPNARRRAKKALLRLWLWTAKKLATPKIALVKTPVAPAAHGTYSRYKRQKCRCDLCMVAQAAYWRDYRKRRPDYRKTKFPVMDLNHDLCLQRARSCR